MSETSYDLIVIGGGPGGYVAAIRAAQLGMRVACVESRERLGGTCLNVGCIPSKALLESSHLFAEAGHGMEAHGVKATGVALDLARMMARKDKVVDTLTKGIGFLFKKNKIEHVRGTGSIPAPGTVEVTPTGGGKKTTLKGTRILVATGSESTPLPGIEVDEQRIVSSTGAIALDEVPENLVVIGAGYIGLELGSVWSRLGSSVTVVEFLDRILPGMDAEVATTMQKLLTRQGITFRLGTKVTSAKAAKAGVALTVEPSSGGKAEQIECDTLLVAVGRRPYLQGLGLENLGVALDERGFVQVNSAFQTSVAGIYAIGDCVPGPMLAHKASEDGVACVETIAGQNAEVDYIKLPGVMYTWPEAATVGYTEETLQRYEMAYRTGKFPFSANPRARANGDADGFVKILADAKTDRVLGVHIVGPDAGTLIHEAVLAMEFGGSAEDIARTVHAHPTLSEAMKEAALGVEGHTIHI